MSLGVELPLDNDLAAGGSAGKGLPSTFGIPDLQGHRQRAVLADRLGFKALWLRDVPLWIPEFGDAGQVFDPFTYLGFLAGVTDNILLGTAAVVLPLRHPLHVAKMAATIDQLSGGRLILGVASGDRPAEYPNFGVDFESRGEQYRTAVSTLRRLWRDSSELPTTSMKVLPAPHGSSIPLISVGRSQQSTEWVAENMDGYMTYHRSAHFMKPVTDKWKHSVPDGQYKPAITTMLVDLLEDPDAPVEPIRFGARLGRHQLQSYLSDLEDSGVAHVALNFRPSSQPVEEALEEIAEYVLPAFTGDATVPSAR
ncbi:LLM class oxidoreductase [Arthrobacter sp. 4R501]|uniref:LLM class oxidoreductase n=1 Tax=Arthrobacter sp. 4R501 TaxID=2058886 RepID=UPI000CE4899E|nr:LLM class oxidoreductase [Arthrobacter sp. 4R501]